MDEIIIQKVKGQKYKALEEYQKLKEAEHPWDKSENWKIAREMELEDLEGTDILEFLEKWVSGNS